MCATSCFSHASYGFFGGTLGGGKKEKAWLNQKRPTSNDPLADPESEAEQGKAKALLQWGSRNKQLERTNQT